MSGFAYHRPEQLAEALGALAERGSLAVAGGTEITASMCQRRRSPWIIRFLQRRGGVTDRAAHLHDAMTVTLERLGAAANAGAATEVAGSRPG